jgi:hypothetical protein
MARLSQKVWKEFQDYIKQYEQTNGVQDIESIRRLARGFAGTKSPNDVKKAEPIYYTLFMSICYLRNTDPNVDPLPDDFNYDNHYDPDGLYPGDKDIEKKLKRFNTSVGKSVLALINERRENSNT